jgi:threonine/homoserine/homoserine lactone efflux protein
MGSIVIKNILNFLDYVLFLGMFYLIYLGLKHGPRIEQLIIELKGVRYE